MVELNIYPRRKELEALLELYPPQPANKFLPDWYKKQKRFTKLETIATDNVLEAKRCPAIVEELSRGIVIPSWSDFHIWKNKGDDKVYWTCEVGKTWNIKHWSWIESQISEQVVGMGLHEIRTFGVFKLISPYLFETPKGYGLYFKDCFYHHRKDVRLLSGYVETDIWHETNLPFEFLVDINEIDEFKLMIKAGDPLFIVDVYKKDENVELDIKGFDEDMDKKHYKNSALMNGMAEDWPRYKKFMK